MHQPFKLKKVLDRTPGVLAQLKRPLNPSWALPNLHAPGQSQGYLQHESCGRKAVA